MTDPIADDEPLSPAQAQIVARVRWLMVISGVATMLGIAVVIGVIGYRVFKSDGRAGPAEATELLPKGGRIVQTVFCVGISVYSALGYRCESLEQKKNSASQRDKENRSTSERAQFSGQTACGMPDALADRQSIGNIA